MSKPIENRASKRGSALATTVIIIAVLSTIMGALLNYSVNERLINERHLLHAQASNTAEAVVEYGFAQLSYVFDDNISLAESTFKTGAAAEIQLPPETFLRSNIAYSDFEVLATAVPLSTLTYIDPNEPDNLFDPLKGKFARSLEVGLYGKATVTDPLGGPNITSYVGQTFEVRDVPLFSHAIFYNLDLDIHAGPKMNIYGPVHTNGDLRLAPVSGIDFHDVTTTAGHVYQQMEHRPGYSSQNGSLRFIDSSNNLQNMKIGNVFMDSKMNTGSISPGFRSFASNLWEGNLLTSAHGITEYKPVAFAKYQEDDPSTAAYDPVNSGKAMIEPALDFAEPGYNAEIETQKMANKAGLYFKWDTTTNTIKAWDKNNNLLDINDLEGSLWEYKNETLLDRRRGRTITTVDIHTGHLKQLIENPDFSDDTLHIGNYDPQTEWNGVVYFECYSSDSDPDNAARLNYTGVRLHGGATNITGQGIPSRGTDPGMTFVSNNSLYIQGNFNADGSINSDSPRFPESGEIPVAVMADSVTFLSKDWTDTDSFIYTKQTAASTEYGTAVVGGIRPGNIQGNNKLSGGNENFPRFLERWSNRHFTLRGSIVCLFESEVDLSTWGGSYYSPPKRGYGFNELFKQGVYPPGTPLLRTYRRSTFQKMSASEYTAATSGL